jgi:hypothetical protein
MFYYPVTRPRHTESRTARYEPSIKYSYTKAIYPLTGRGDLYGCEMLRIPHCNRLADSRKVVTLRTDGTLLPRNIIFLLSALISVRGC